MFTNTVLSSSPTFLIQSQADCSNPLTVFNSTTRSCDALPVGSQPPHLDNATKQDIANRIAANFRPPSFNMLGSVGMFQRIAFKDDQTDVANRAISLGAKSDDVISALRQARTNFPPIDPFAVSTPPPAPPPATSPRKVPFFETPLFWVAVAGSVVVVGGGVWAISRRRKAA